MPVLVFEMCEKSVQTGLYQVFELQLHGINCIESQQFEWQNQFDRAPIISFQAKKQLHADRLSAQLQHSVNLPERCKELL